MAKEFNISVPGPSAVVIADLGERTFPSLTAGLNLYLEYTPDELFSSADLQAALTAGDITAVDENSMPITDVTDPSGGTNVTIVQDLLTPAMDEVLSTQGAANALAGKSDTSHTHTASQITDFDAEVSNNTDVAANSSKVGITPSQASDITTNNAKVGITPGQAANIVANNAKVGITPTQASDITTNNGKVGITVGQASDIVANNAKVGITPAQTADIIANNAKTGITPAQATAITDNATNLTNHENNTSNPHEVTFSQAVAQDGATDITPAEAEELTDGSTTTLHKHKQIVQFGMRWDCFTNNRWVTFNIQQGFNAGSATTNRGTLASPTADWDAVGILLPAGAILNRLIIKGRTNNVQVTDMEICVRTHEADMTTGAAIDSDLEIGEVEVLAPVPLLHTKGGPGNMSDMHVTEVSLGDHVMSQTGDVHIIMRPVGLLTATRQFRTTMILEYTI